MNDYWKNVTRHYPVSLKIKHFENICVHNKTSDSVEFGFGHLVKELIDASYEENLARISVNIIDHFGYEIWCAPFDYPREPLLFDYNEIRKALQEFVVFKTEEDMDDIENMVITKIVKLLDRHYYCPYGVEITLEQYLKLTGFSKTKQKELLKEKKVLINGSNQLVNMQTKVNEQDQIMISGEIIPRYCKNKIEVEKWESW